MGAGGGGGGGRSTGYMSPNDDNKEADDDGKSSAKWTSKEREVPETKLVGSSSTPSAAANDNPIPGRIPNSFCKINYSPEAKATVETEDSTLKEASQIPPCESLNDTGHDGIISTTNTASSNPNSVLVSTQMVGTDEGSDVTLSVEDSVNSGPQLQLSSLDKVPRENAKTDQHQRDSQVKARVTDLKSIYVEGFERNKYPDDIKKPDDVKNFCYEHEVYPSQVTMTKSRGGMCCVFERICLIFYLCAYFLCYLSESYNQIFN